MPNHNRDYEYDIDDNYSGHGDINTGNNSVAHNRKNQRRFDLVSIISKEYEFNIVVFIIIRKKEATVVKQRI